MCTLAGLAGHNILVLFWSFKNRDDSTLRHFKGHGTQHMSQKSGCPAKNGTVGKYEIVVQKITDFTVEISQ